ncbi:hypothetical protein AB0C33_37365 [Nonomuraea sp. NPDC048881]|uniref:hypothetical protein n=1 Tax=Nonomuraea sp. NPDC048881 TaxID=3155030 RepID=UPI0033D48403
MGGRARVLLVRAPGVRGRARALLVRVPGVRGWVGALLVRRLRRAVASTGPQAALAAMVELVRDGLPAAGVAVELAGVRIAAGEPGPVASDVPLVWHGRAVGRLLITPYADPRTVAAITPYVAGAAHSMAVTADLRRARERVLAIREEERRRLHHDLREGLGRALRDLAGTVDAAATGHRTDPAAADRLLHDLSAAMNTISQEIRTLLQDPRPHPARPPLQGDPRPQPAPSPLPGPRPRVPSPRLDRVRAHSGATGVT